jgi:uncharacterized protein (DUF4415 family)
MHAVSDNPAWTKDDFARARRLEEVLPALASAIRRRGKQKAPLKKAVSMRLDADVVEAYRATGPGWQSRINSDLRKAKNLG